MISIWSKRAGSILLACASNLAFGSVKLNSTETNDGPSNQMVRGSILASYQRTGSDESAAEFKSSTGAKLLLSWNLSEAEEIAFSTGVSRSLNALEEFNDWSATTASYSNTLPAVFYSLVPSLETVLVLPTNASDRFFLSYRGGIRGGLSIARKFASIGPVKDINLRLNNSFSRAFYEFDSSRAGTPNRIWGQSHELSLGVKLGSLGLNSSYGLGRALRSNDSWTSYEYTWTNSISNNFGHGYSLAFEFSNRDLAFGYDVEEVNFLLLDEERTNYRVSATYSF
jgi:hypothetical protein